MSDIKSMETAPQDRPILVKVKNTDKIEYSSKLEHNYGFTVVHYVARNTNIVWLKSLVWCENDEGSGSYFNTKDLLGWWDLPKE